MMAPSLVDGGQAIRTVRPRDAGFTKSDVHIGNRARPSWLWDRQLAALCDRRVRLDVRSVDLDRVRTRRGAHGRASNSLWRFGWTIGAGIEFPFAPNWTARAEYLFTEFGNHAATFPRAAERVRCPISRISQLRLGLNYQSARRPRGTESYYQSNTGSEPGRHCDPRPNDVHQPICVPISLPYQGANSLASNAGREGWDVTLYAGLRPWQGAEIWINPEIDQGFALSDFRGVAGLCEQRSQQGRELSVRAHSAGVFCSRPSISGGKSRRSRRTSISLQRREPPIGW